MVAAGTALLARLDAAFKQWRRDCGSFLSEADVEATKGRRDVLAAMLASDKFAEFGQAAAREIDYLEADAEERRERAIKTRAQERVRHASGQGLSKALLKAAPAINSDLRAELEKAAAGQLSVTEMDKVLSRATQAAFQVASEDVTPGQKALAQRLSGQEVALSFEAWRAQVAEPDIRLQSVFSLLSELEALGLSFEASTLERELHLVHGLTDDSMRNMRWDTLLLAARKVRDGALAKVKLFRQLELLSAELLSISPASEVVQKIQAATLTLSFEQLQALFALGRQELSRVQSAAAAVARRKAVLEGLQRLGYQVQEGLATMAAEAGRLVVRSPRLGGYGVELVTGVNQKVQVRSVAFEETRDTSQDVAEERRWCSDFGKLQAALQASGCEVAIEKALGVGAAPLRVVEAIEEHRRRAVAPRQAGK